MALRPIQQDVLDALAEAEFALSVKQLIVRMTRDYGHPETHRAVRWLCEHGLASEPQQDGPRVFEITEAGRTQRLQFEPRWPESDPRRRPGGWHP